MQTSQIFIYVYATFAWHGENRSHVVTGSHRHRCNMSASTPRQKPQNRPTGNLNTRHQHMFCVHAALKTEQTSKKIKTRQTTDELYPVEVVHQTQVAFLHATE